MAESPKKNNDLKKEIDKTAKLFDVAKPGKTPPSASSRPTIVGHSPMIKRDPMVKDSGSEAAVEGPAPEEPEEKLAPHIARKIVPLGDKSEDEVKKDEPEAEDPAKEESAELKIDVKKVEKPAEEVSELPESEEPAEEETAKKEEPEEEKPEEQAEEPAEEEPVEKDPTGAAVEALAGEVSAKREEQKQKEELAAKTAEVESTIAKKEFFVPIGQESRRRSSNRILFGLILLIVLALVALNFAADAELLDVGMDPFTDIM